MENEMRRGIEDDNDLSWFSFSVWLKVHHSKEAASCELNKTTHIRHDNNTYLRSQLFAILLEGSKENLKSSNNVYITRQKNKQSSIKKSCKAVRTHEMRTHDKSNIQNDSLNNHTRIIDAYCIVVILKEEYTLFNALLAVNKERTTKKWSKND